MKCINLRKNSMVSLWNLGSVYVVVRFLVFVRNMMKNGSASSVFIISLLTEIKWWNDERIERKEIGGVSVGKCFHWCIHSLILSLLHISSSYSHKLDRSQNEKIECMYTIKKDSLWSLPSEFRREKEKEHRVVYLANHPGLVSARRVSTENICE